MSTNNMGNKKNIYTFRLKKKKHLMESNAGLFKILGEVE